MQCECAYNLSFTVKIRAAHSTRRRPSVALKTYLGEVKIHLADIQISKRKNKLPTNERLAIKKLKETPNINIKKADKGTCTVHGANFPTLQKVTMRYQMQATSNIFFKRILAFVLGLYLLYQHRLLAVACFHKDNFS